MTPEPAPEQEKAPETDNEHSPPEENQEDGNPEENPVMNFFKTLVSDRNWVRFKSNLHVKVLLLLNDTVWGKCTVMAAVRSAKINLHLWPPVITEGTLLFKELKLLKLMFALRLAEAKKFGDNKINGEAWICLLCVWFHVKSFMGSDGVWN